MSGYLKHPFVITKVPPQKARRGVKSRFLSHEVIGGPPVPVLQFKIFTVLWAIASLFHMAHSSVFDAQLNLAFLTLAAFFAIFRPSLTSFLLLIALQIFDAAFRMPFTTNHWIFTALVNATLLHVLIYMMFRNKSFQVEEGQFFKAFAPLVRVEVIILYFFAVFHKLNAGFFAPATSCATDLLLAQNLDQLIPLTSEVLTTNAYLTLIIELSIPVMLCIRQTRVAGVLMGVVFHSILSYSTYNAFFDFSSLMFAVYFVFLAPGFSLTAYRSLQGLRTFRTAMFRQFSWSNIAYLSIIIVLSLAVFYVLNKRLDTYQSVHLYFFWTFYCLLFTACIISFLLARKHDTQFKDFSFKAAHWSLLAVPAVVFLNGTVPYLGLKTENSYAMFSNLRTEGGESNHFIVPASAQIFDFQKDVVEIVSSTDPFLQKFADEGLALVLFEFRSYVNDRQPERVEYLLNGEKKTLRADDRASQLAVGRNPYVLQKLMKFRPFSINGPQPCEH